MKIFGAFIASVLLANLALADETTAEQDDKLVLAARAPKEVAIEPAEVKAAAPELKVIDVDLSDQLQSLNNKISTELETKLNEQMRQKLEDF